MKSNCFLHLKCILMLNWTVGNGTTFEIETVLMLNWIIWNRIVYCIRLDLALNNLQRLICHKAQTNKKLYFLPTAVFLNPDIHQIRSLNNSKQHHFKFALNWDKLIFLLCSDEYDLLTFVKNILQIVDTIIYFYKSISTY